MALSCAKQAKGIRRLERELLDLQRSVLGSPN